MRALLLPPTLLVILAAVATAAPALGDQPPKWEYAELTYRNVPGRPALIDGDGKEVPATPASVTIRWISGAGEVEVKGWDELADKLKAPAPKKGSAAYLKIQVLNSLGADGWELMEQSGTSPSSPFSDAPARGDRGPGADRGPGFRSTATSTWLLKRRVP
jgi:hypothetical protein